MEVNNRDTVAPVRLVVNGQDLTQASRVIGDAVSRGVRTAEVSLDTPKTVILPSELAEGGVGATYLRFNGMEPSKGERVAMSGKGGDITAVMAADGGIMELLERSFRTVTYTSPLLEPVGRGKRFVSIFLTAENAYITVWNRGLRFAEALPDPSSDSLLYYLQTLGREFRLRRFDIHIGGEGASAAAAAISQYFKHVRAC